MKSYEYIFIISIFCLCQRALTLYKNNYLIPFIYNNKNNKLLNFNHYNNIHKNSRRVLFLSNTINDNSIYNSTNSDSDINGIKPGKSFLAKAWVAEIIF